MHVGDSENSVCNYYCCVTLSVLSIMKTLPTFNLGVSDAEPTLSPHTNKEPEAPSRSAMTSERDSLQGGESGDVDYGEEAVIWKNHHEQPC